MVLLALLFHLLLGFATLIPTSACTRGTKEASSVTEPTSKKNASSVDQLSCASNHTLLIRGTYFSDQTTDHVCNNTCTPISSDVTCYHRYKDEKCSARISLRTLSRIYTAFDSGNLTSIDKDLSKLGNYTICYECIHVKRTQGSGQSPPDPVNPCQTVTSENNERAIAIFPELQDMRSHCEMLCTITPEFNAYLTWEYQFVLKEDDSTGYNYISYEIYKHHDTGSSQSEVRFQTAYLVKKDIGEHVHKITLRFRFTNVGKEVSRFYLKFLEAEVKIDCETDARPTTPTARTSTKKPAVSSTKKPAVPTDGISPYVHYVLPAVVAVVGIGTILIVVMMKKRRNRSLTNEESSRLLSVCPRCTDNDENPPNHHPENCGRTLTLDSSETAHASHQNPPVSHVTGSGNDDGQYGVLDHHGTLGRKRAGEEGGDDDDYHHIVLNQSDGLYARFQREGRRPEVLDNLYDHTVVGGD